ncbi:MAG: alpha/beta hydrolase [Lachnospiraceae bacterium]|nr:alpha/beta hydrolase [Lachnospiraceae bacterium]
MPVSEGVFVCFESLYVDINGSKQWINIYGQKKDNPILLFLHGGPGGAMSAQAYPVLRKLSDIYTVVNWDQRGCGLSWTEDMKGTHVTFEQLFEDGEAMTAYLLDRFGVDRISVMGISWGAVFGANLVLDHPEHYDKLIALSMIVDGMETQKAYKEKALELTKDDPELHRIAENIMTEQSEYDSLPYEELIKREIEAMSLNENCVPQDTYKGDFNQLLALIFNPDYTLKAYFNVLASLPKDIESIDDSFCYYYCISSGSYKAFSVLKRTEYKVPVYIVMGNKDYTVMTSVTKKYFDSITAPHKEYYEVEGGHDAPMLRSEELSGIVHSIPQ